MEDFLKAITNVGHPITVAAYLLIRIESKMDSLAASINQFSPYFQLSLAVMMNENLHKKVVSKYTAAIYKICYMSGYLRKESILHL